MGKSACIHCGEILLGAAVVKRPAYLGGRCGPCFVQRVDLAKSAMMALISEPSSDRRTHAGLARVAVECADAMMDELYTDAD